MTRARVRVGLALGLWCAGAFGACGGNDPGALPPPDAAPPECVIDANCADDNDCTLDLCLSGVCSNEPTLEGETCDDGLACTELERCVAGVCTGEPLDCGSLGDLCNAGTC